MTPQTLSTFRAYRAQRVALRRNLTTSVRQTFLSTADPDDIAGSFALIGTRLAPVVSEGQRRSVTQAGAFLRQLALVQTGRLIEPSIPAVIGLTQKGLPILEGMAALGPMVLGSIRDGKPLDEALDFGQFLFGRFADSEVMRAADETVEEQFGRQRLIGWEGIVANPCALCAANEGFHELNEALYRHGTCQCERVPVYA